MYSIAGAHQKGLYIETFIPPDELGLAHLRANIIKVKEACECAASLNIPVVSLGGITSIVLESGNTSVAQIKNSFFTTGNTLTAAFITEAVNKACEWWDQPLRHSNLLIVGASGDIGSACARFFAGKTNKLLLCARRLIPLQKIAKEIRWDAGRVEVGTNINYFLPHADIMICVASSMLEHCDLSLLPEHAIICDAGYPKNLQYGTHSNNRKIFWGGMGQVLGGFCFNPDYKNAVYSFPSENIVHGCLLESIVLAMADSPTAFSIGRGNITLKAMEEILALGAKHGIIPAPLFNESGLMENNLEILIA
jgi:predicted amino acid dehydrogenase